MLRSLRRLKEFFEVQLSFELEPPKPVAVVPKAALPKERTHPADERYVRELTRIHRELNALKFGGELSDIPIRVSRRMKRRVTVLTRPSF